MSCLKQSDCVNLRTPAQEYYSTKGTTHYTLLSVSLAGLRCTLQQCPHHTAGRSLSSAAVCTWGEPASSVFRGELQPCHTQQHRTSSGLQSKEHEARRSSVLSETASSGELQSCHTQHLQDFITGFVKHWHALPGACRAQSGDSNLNPPSNYH